MVASLDELCRHLVDHHHARTRQLLMRARQDVRGPHTPTSAGTEELELLLRGLEQDLSRHMLVEETVLFPYVGSVCSGVPLGAGDPGDAARVAGHDHAGVHALLRRVRMLADRLRVGGAGTLAELEADLEVHSQLEDEVLLPRLRAIEEQIARGRRPMRDTQRR